MATRIVIQRRTLRQRAEAAVKATGFGIAVGSTAHQERVALYMRGYLAGRRSMPEEREVLTALDRECGEFDDDQWAQIEKGARAAFRKDRK